MIIYIILGILILWVILYLVFTPKEKRIKKKKEFKTKKASDLLPYSPLFK